MKDRCPQEPLHLPTRVAWKCTAPHRRLTRLYITALWSIAFCLLVLGCNTQVNSSAEAQDDGVLSGNTLRPVEEEQIENVVIDYFVRDSASPEYTVTIEEVDQSWARVSMSPIGVQNTEANIVYLQDQSATAIEAPTPDPDANPGNIAPVETTSGWTIIAGPQVTFSEEELDAAGIPPFIRE